MFHHQRLCQTVTSVCLQYQQRILFMHKPIDEEMGNQMVATMLFLDSESRDDIQLYINCSGGDVRASAAHLLVHALAASSRMSSHILLYGQHSSHRHQYRAHLGSTSALSIVVPCLLCMKPQAGPRAHYLCCKHTDPAHLMAHQSSAGEHYLTGKASAAARMQDNSRISNCTHNPAQAALDVRRWCPAWPSTTPCAT